MKGQKISRVFDFLNYTTMLRASSHVLCNRTFYNLHGAHFICSVCKCLSSVFWRLGFNVTAIHSACCFPSLLLLILEILYRRMQCKLILILASHVLRHRHCNEVVQPPPKAGYLGVSRNKHDWRRWDLNVSPLTPQSDTLPTRPLPPG